MKHLLVIFGIILSALNVYAQKRFDDVIYLKNGHRLQGMIMEYVPNFSYKILSADSLYFFKLDEISRITKEPAVLYRFKPRGYVGICESGTAYFPSFDGLNGTPALPLASVNIVNAFQFDPFFAMGLGTGAEISAASVYEMPVTLDMRIYSTQTRAAHFIALAFGYDLHIIKLAYYNTTFLHSMVFNSETGLRLAVNHKLALSLASGYHLLLIHYKERNYLRQLSPAYDLLSGFHIKFAFHY